MAEKYDVTGMSCAACQLHVEKAVAKVPGVEAVTVSLLTNSMTVEGSAASESIIKAVEDAGYGASIAKEEQDKPEDKETKAMVLRFVISLIFLVILMYIGMGHMMWGLPVPGFLSSHAATGISEMILTVLIMIINRKFFISGFKAISHGSPNMDTLVALGAGASFLYSLGALFLLLRSTVEGDMERAGMLGMDHMYFESAAMILTLITLGKTLEAYSKGRTTDALRSLIKLRPQSATVERDGKTLSIGINDVRKGDVFIVKPGESIPVDGVIIEGSTAVNEAALTGEAIPLDKKEGDEVYTATINTSGYIKARASRVGEDTTLSQIIKMVSDAASTKAPIGRIADKVSGIFCPVVIALSVLTFAGWMILGAGGNTAFVRAVSVLVISCPCALGLATPVAIMVGNGLGARNGILYKTAASLEEAGRTAIVTLDKTGTVTNGLPVVTDIFEEDGVTKERLLEVAASLESKSEHPLSKAIVEYASENGTEIFDVEDFKAVPGRGLQAGYSGDMLYGGNIDYISEHADVSDRMKAEAGRLAEEGKTPLFFAEAGKTAGIIAVADTIKDDSREAVRQLKGMGIKVVMLTGDNEKTAAAIGKAAGVDKVIAGVLPDGKEKEIRSLQEEGRTAMVGDGINDAPALTRADTGMAIGAGTDVAIDAADIVLVKSRLTDVPAAIRLSRATIRNIHENLFWAFFYNVICIPLAMGVYQALFHWDFEMKPAVGALAMSFSSVTVCLNALRLNLFRLYDTAGDRKVKNRRSKIRDIRTKDDNIESMKEEGKMTKTMQISGMMCAHCEMNVKKALEALDGVASAEVSHEAGTAKVELTAEVADDVLKAAVEEKDYEVTAIN